MAKIYRYEKKMSMGFIGPYVGRGKEEILDKMMEKHNWTEEHPSIRIDLRNFEFGNYFCACPTLESLKTWFKGYNTALNKLGFKLVEIEVKEVYNTISGKQVAYKLDDIISKKILK